MGDTIPWFSKAIPRTTASQPNGAKGLEAESRTGYNPCNRELPAIEI
jgi:hypothetical protein